jgi:hypothetical protein
MVSVVIFIAVSVMLGAYSFFVHTEFLFKLRLIDPKTAEHLNFEFVDGWSKHNQAVSSFFFHRDFKKFGNSELNLLGNKLLGLWISSASFAFAGVTIAAVWG